jgi:multicomponent Na+:H+ antiporter subunit E
MIRLLYLIRYFFIFLRELTLATWAVTKLVLTPSPRLRPGFVAFPMETRSDLEITALANSITLTPGTISVHVERGQGVLVIHAIDIGDDPQSVRDSIQSALEANILKWTRPRTTGKEGRP